MRTRLTTNRSREQEIRQIINGLRAIFRAERRHSQRLAKTHQITTRQLGAVRIVSQSPGISLSDLSDRMYVHISTGSGIIDRVERKRLLTRKRSPQDRRVMQLYVTPAGSRITKAIPTTNFGFFMRDIEALRADKVHAIWTGMNELLGLLRLENDLTRAERVE